MDDIHAAHMAGLDEDQNQVEAEESAHDFDSLITAQLRGENVELDGPKKRIFPLLSREQAIPVLAESSGMDPGAVKEFLRAGWGSFDDFIEQANPEMAWRVRVDRTDPFNPDQSIKWKTLEQLREVPDQNVETIDLASDFADKYRYEAEIEKRLAERIKVIKALLKASLKLAIKHDLDEPADLDEQALDESCDKALNEFIAFARPEELSSFLTPHFTTGLNEDNPVAESVNVIAKKIYEISHLERSLGTQILSLDIVFAGNYEGMRQAAVDKILAEIQPYGEDFKCIEAAKAGFVQELWQCAIEDADTKYCLVGNDYVESRSAGILSAQYLLAEMPSEAKQFFDRHKDRLQPFFAKKSEAEGAESPGRFRLIRSLVKNFLSNEPRDESPLAKEKLAEMDAESLERQINTLAGKRFAELAKDAGLSAELSELDQPGVTLEQVTDMIQKTLIFRALRYLTPTQRVLVHNQYQMASLSKLPDNLLTLARIMPIRNLWMDLEISGPDLTLATLKKDIVSEAQRKKKFEDDLEIARQRSRESKQT